MNERLVEDWFLVNNEDRLRHAVKADTEHPYISYEEVRVGHSKGGTVISEEVKLVEVGRLEPKVLRKLKPKGIFSLREDFAREGEVYIADRIIHERT